MEAHRLLTEPRLAGAVSANRLKLRKQKYAGPLLRVAAPLEK